MTRTVLITDRFVYLPGRRIAEAPAVASVGELIDRIAAMIGDADDGAVLVDPFAAAKLGLPVTADQASDDHPALTSIRDAGWTVTGLREWTIIYAPNRPTVHLGIMPLMTVSRSPILAAGDYSSIVDACEVWRDRVGATYHGTPGVAGISAIRAVATAGARAKSPTWCPKETGPGDAYEMDYHAPSRDHPTRPVWRGPVPAESDRFLIGFDLSRMYLGAMQAVAVAPWSLKPTGPDVEWTPQLAGWWLCEFAPWQDPHLPDPAGYPSHVDHTGARWVTGATLSLLHELMEDGVHGGYTVLDSYTGPAKRILRPVAERQIKAWQDVDLNPAGGALDNAVRVGIQAALKPTYREAWGMLNAPNSRVKRPDWHYAVMAQARTNLWRRIRKVGDQTGRWPLMIDVDNLYYPCRTGDAVAEADALSWSGPKGQPEGIVLGDRPGAFKPKKTLPLGKGA